MTTSSEGKEDPVAPPETPAAQDTPVEEPKASAAADTEATAPKEDPQLPNAVAANGAPKKRGRKRKVSAVEDLKASAGVHGEKIDEAIAGGGGQPVKRVVKRTKPPVVEPEPVAAPAAPGKKKMGRPRKTAIKEESETEDEAEIELSRRVEALPEEHKAKFGSVVWAKMVGFPFWPALIMDPRRLAPQLQASALKLLDTKHYVCFYHSKNFYPVLFKHVLPYDDKSADYRSGHPAKDAKAPKRRSHLMLAIEEADKEVSLPVEKRMDGLLGVKEEPPVEVDAVPAAPAPAKRRPGRPAGSKNKPKTVTPASEEEAPAPTTATSAPKARRGRKKAVAETTEATAVTPAETTQVTPETPEEEEPPAPPLSKDEIIAKVSSRKVPSKKKTPSAEEKEAASAAKKATKTAASSAKAEKPPASEIDSKRKKEIELVVPRKTVKSADIREATDEAARKKTAPREKPKDKGEYKVGNLTNFAGKMNRLHANESSKNNDELIQMLTQLFNEKLVYRSDMERSGVAAVIAALRKSTNPTVAQTASAVRKHLINVLNNDVSSDQPTTKKTKAASEPVAKPAKKVKSAAATTPEPVASPPKTKSVPVAEQSNGTSSPEEPETDAEKGDSVSADVAPAPVESVVESEQIVEDTKPVSPIAEQAVPSSPKIDLALNDAKPDPSTDKARMNCIEMLKKALAPIGEKNVEIARAIEEQVFDRFSESNDEYRACARSITFGLKKNAKVRERLNNGSLHALELAYSHEEILKDA